MIDIGILMNLHRVLDQEPDATGRAANLMMLDLTFALHTAGFDAGRARELLIEMHRKTLETLAEFEQDEKRPYH